MKKRDCVGKTRSDTVARGPRFWSSTIFRDSSNQTFQRMVLRTVLIAQKPFILLNGSPKPVFQYQFAEDYCLGNSKTGHSKERFSEPVVLRTGPIA
jgi:hypothetical protein